MTYPHIPFYPARPAQRTVEEYLQRLPASQQKLARALREVVLAAVPELTESMRWNLPCYGLPGGGGAMDGLLCSIVAGKDQVSLEFYLGAQLADEGGVLEGARKNVRQVTVRQAGDIDADQLAAWVRQSAALTREERAPAGTDTRRRRTPASH